MKRFLSCILIIALMLTTVIISYADGDNSKFKTGLYITTASVLNIRAGPSINDTVNGKIPIGTVVEITKTEGSWGKVKYEDAVGWISMDYAEPFTDMYHNLNKYAVKWNVIDVSKWQGKVDWEKVASEGIKGVIIRIGLRGSATKVLHIDDKFLEYYKGAKKQGLYVGCYFYSAATTVKDVNEEANFVIKTLRDNNIELDMPAFIDVEDDVILKCGKTTIFNITKAYLDAMDKANIYSGVYCSASWATDYYNQSLFNSHALWVADWKGDCDYSGPYSMWQYSETGKINGIETKYTDMNYCYVDFPQLIKDYKYNKNNMTEEETENVVVEEEACTTPDVPENFEQGTIPEKTPEKESETDIKKEPITETKTETEQVCTIGDVDRNGSITSSDARLTLRFATSIDIPVEEQFYLADINADKKITSSDARIILRIVAMLDDVNNYI